MSAKIHILGLNGLIVNTIAVANLEDWPGAIDASEGGVIGQYKNESGDWVFPEPDDQAIGARWQVVRAERNSKLSASDWTQLDDTPLTNTAKQEWATYRQALRDITTQPDPFNIVWPELPA